MAKRPHNPHPYRLEKPTGCDIEGCERPHYVNGLCVPHWQRRQQYGDPLAGPPMRRQRGTVGDDRQRGSAPDYYTKHRMVRDARGPAWQHNCEHCPNAAQSWAMLHDTAGETPDDYLPLCWSCHAKYDEFISNLRG